VVAKKNLTPEQYKEFEVIKLLLKMSLAL